MNLREQADVPACPAEIERVMESHVGIHVNRLTQEALREAGCWETVCVLPNDFNRRVQYLGNLLVQMVPKIIEDDDLRSTVGQLSQALSYMLNSTSWEDGELHSFDKDELKRKLRRFIR